MARYLTPLIVVGLLIPIFVIGLGRNPNELP
jgi:hypothetical protein